MWIDTSSTTKAWVTWRPPHAYLHRAELYRGLWEYLRMPPSRADEAEARDYLRQLLEYPYAPLQQDRIQWVRAWLGELPVEEKREKVVGKSTYSLLSVVCYQPPPMVLGVGKLRAG